MANEIRYGGRTFTQYDISSGNCYLVTSLLSESLEINTLEFEVRSTDDTLTSFIRNAPLTYLYNGEQVGIFYVQSVSRVGAESYQFKATSAIGLLDQVKHYGGIYTGQTVADVVAGICGAIPYSIKTKYQRIKLYGWLPIATSRENLSQVLFAVGATVKTDLGGVIRMEGLWDGISGTVDQDRMYLRGSVKYDSTVSSVSVTEHQYAEGGEETKLFEGTTQEGDVITFDEPMYGLKASGFTIRSSNANHAKVSSGSGTLTGKKYVHNTREIIKVVSTGATANVVTVKEATLVSLVNSEAVAERVANYYRCRESIDTDVVYEKERPGDRLAVWHPYDRLMSNSCLQSVDLAMSAKLKAVEKSLVGFVPPKVEEAVTYESQQILTGSGTWKVPEGVTSIRVVLIGGGQGGTGGRSGASGEANKLILTSAEVEAGGTWTCPVGQGGAGGNGGQPGTAGKVYQGSLSVVPGQSISYACGSKGTGGSGNGGQGSLGGNTTFGAVSSASGSTLPSGYTDVLTGTVYAKPGIAGRAGVKGGTGGGATLSNFYPGNDGDSTGGYSGGKGGEGSYYNRTSTPASKQRMGGGGGGGATEGAQGGSGSGYNGGPGGGPSSPPAASIFGSAGNGGNGGGGGGGTGALYYTVERYPSGSSSSGVWFTPSPGTGGSGAAGASGAAGCAIVYYTQRKTIASGPVKDKTGRYLLDKTGRRIIV